MKRATGARPEWQRGALMLCALLLGAAWAAWNLQSTGLERSEATLRPLIWAVFATPAALCLGWIVARRHEWRLALAISGGLYFFGIFIAARLAALLDPASALEVGPHPRYFELTLGLHLLVGVVVVIWRNLPRKTG